MCILILFLCIFIVPTGTLRLRSLRVFRTFSSVVRQMPRYNPQRRGTVRTLPKLLFLYIFSVLCRSVYCLCVNVYCTNATGCNQIVVNKYISYHISYLVSYHIIYHILYHIISYHIIYHIIYYIIIYHIISSYNISYIVLYLIVSIISYNIMSYVIS